MTVEEDQEQWATSVINANGSDLLRYFARRVDAADVPDLVSETYAVIWERRSGLPQDAESARMWAYGVARNSLRRRNRDRYRLNRLLIMAADAAKQSAHFAADPAETVEKDERALDVRRALAGLRSRDRDLIMLVHWDDFSLVEAAEHLGINASTVRTRYARAKARLAAELGQHRRSGGVSLTVARPQVQP